MRNITDARVELLRLRSIGAEGVESKRDEVQAMGPASASMHLILILLNRCLPSYEVFFIRESLRCLD